MTEFLPGEGWEVDADGVPVRHAARVLLFDGDDRLLLVRGHDADAPERSWWFTVGGGIDPGETPRQAAAREVGEETGIVLDPAALLGPVARRSAEFDFSARTVIQHEEFFALRLPGRGAEAFSREGWTAVEHSFMDEIRWWSVEALREVELEVFPAQLVELAGGVLAELGDAVDGDWSAPVIDLGFEAEGVSLASEQDAP